MLRRTLCARVGAKAPQTPGPTTQSWGRTAQKRRLEYEASETKYGERAQSKEWDMLGLEVRNTAHTQQRVYFNYPQRWLGYAFNFWSYYAIALCGGAIPTWGMYTYVKGVDAATKRAAWW